VTDHLLELTPTGYRCSCGQEEQKPYRNPEVSAGRAVAHLPRAERHPVSAGANPLRRVDGDGKIAPGRRVLIWEYQGQRCAYCDRPLALVNSSIDHVVSRGVGGGHDWGNLVIACKQCNSAKGPMSIAEWAASEYAPRHVRRLVAEGHQFGTPNLDRLIQARAVVLNQKRTRHGYPSLADAFLRAGVAQLTG
jgi:5-methylcytosine-specific restriction endonuclease McrA